MSLEREGMTFIASCDSCSNYTDTEEFEFMAAVWALKRKEWLVFKKMGEWFHKCPVCRDKDNSSDFDVVK